MLRKLVYIFLIIFFLMASLAAYTVISSVSRTEQAVVQPIGNLMRQLFVPATPVILPNPVTIVQQVNDLARLETVSMEMEKIVTADRNRDVLWGIMGENLIFVAYGKVVAGIDFAEMTVEDIQVVDPVTVMVHLPEAKIFDDLPVLDNERSYVANRSTGLLTRADPVLETQVRREAEAAIREAAMGSDILERANHNAQQYMTNFLRGLGFEQIIFTDQPPPVPPPYNPELPKGFVTTTPAAPIP